ncbi:MAG TPA: hypothetical protein VNH22_05635 [Blastocatellia bacterium]|jgi:hypothetical protein|nr:hypothetical protein [Blastocatellia bacterium]
MELGIEIARSAAGEAFERDFMGGGEVIVRREGNSRARHLFITNNRTMARLRWQGLRRAVYEAGDERLEINVGALAKRIAVVSEDGSESFLIERSRANPNRAHLRVEMAEGDNFYLLRSWDSRFRSQVALTVQKEFYNSTLLAFNFDTIMRTQSTVRIEVKQTMKWESRFIHRFFALVVCRIILERRSSGSKPMRVKEKPRRFTSSARVRDRKHLNR